MKGNLQTAGAEDQAFGIGRIARGDRGALRALYEAHAPRASAIGLALLKDRSEAEEVVQETFIEVWRRAGEFDPRRGSLAAWVTSIARSRAIDRLRARRKAGRVAVALELEPSGPPPPPPVELASAREERERVLAALRKLPDEQRVVVELAYYDGLSQSEIADRRQEPLGTVKTRVRLAMRKLVDLLGDTGEAA